MEGRPMRNLCQRALASAAVALSATLILSGSSRLHAEEKAAQKPSAAALSAALQMTSTRGVPTVAVLTSSEQPPSVRVWNEVYNSAWARANRGFVEVVNVSKDTDPALVRTMEVSHFPTTIVYVKGAKGVRVLGTIADCDTADALVARVRTLDLGLSSLAKADQAVSPVGYVSDGYPSAQTQSPSPPYCPPVTATAPQPQQMTLSAAPTQSLQATANVIQVPSQNLMIQQCRPRSSWLRRKRRSSTCPRR